MTLQRFLDTIHSDDRERIAHALQESFVSTTPANGSSMCLAGQHCALDSRNWTGVPPRGKRACLMRGVAIDITERKQAEALAARALHGFGVSRTPCQRRYLRRRRMARPTISISNGRYTPASRCMRCCVSAGGNSSIPMTSRKR